ncbi:MAG TPA: oligosaccharide flippase family protein [Polyangia bacterium]|nr:oligosaccharide flippase family protein [Polyangia bacterium]
MTAETERAADADSKDVSHAARSGAMQALTAVAQALLLVTHVLLARLFGPAVFGSYLTCLAIIEALTRAGPGGADKGMLRYVAAHRARGEPDLVRRALGTGLRLAFSIAGTLAVTLIATSWLIARAYHQQPLAAALRLMAPAAVFTACVYVLVNASLAAKVTWANLVVRGLGEPLLLMAAGLLAALFGRTLLHLAVAQVLAAAATFTLALFAVGRVFGRGEIERAARAPGLPGFVRFSIPLGVGELMNTVLQRADIFLLTAFLGPSTTAVYAAAEFISRVIGNPRYIFDGVAAPVFSEALHLNQRERLRTNLQLMTRWVATAAAPIAVTAMALRHDLLAAYGPAFQAGATAIVLLAAGHLVSATLGLTGYIILVAGRSRLVLVNNVVGAIANVTLGRILIPRFGMLGAASAALASVILFQGLYVVQVFLAHRILPLSRALLKPLAAAAAMLVVELWIVHHIAHMAQRIPLAIVGGLLSYLGALVALGLAPEDKRLLADIWNRVRPRER